MHIPDGFLSLKVNIASIAVSAAAMYAAVRSTKKALSDRAIPMMGVLAAFIFAAQMFNFPVAGGTSGHLLGGMLAAFAVGPFAATIVMSVVLIVQCLLFQDGGFIAIGANILNMAVIGTWVGYGIYASVGNFGNGRLIQNVAVFLGAWASVVAASSACALELSLSGVVPFNVSITAMTAVHSVIGIGEGMITVIAISILRQVRPKEFNGAMGKAEPQ
jgi:cobalt/nickel transport system permease protein